MKLILIAIPFCSIGLLGLGLIPHSYIIETWGIVVEERVDLRKTLFFNGGDGTYIETQMPKVEILASGKQGYVEYGSSDCKKGMVGKTSLIVMKNIYVTWIYNFVSIDCSNPSYLTR